MLKEQSFAGKPPFRHLIYPMVSIPTPVFWHNGSTPLCSSSVAIGVSLLSSTAPHQSKGHMAECAQACAVNEFQLIAAAKRGWAGHTPITGPGW